MQPIQGPMVSGKRLADLWKCCRFIGIINKIIIWIEMFGLVMFSFILLTECSICQDFNVCKKISEQLNLFSTSTKTILQFVILLFIYSILLFMLKLIHVNNRLRSTQLPADGNKVKSWLRWYTVIFMACVIELMVFLTTAPFTFELYFGGISIVYLIEIYVVWLFIKEFDISADIHFQS